MYPGPGSVITPGGSSTGPDNDPRNPVAKPWSDEEIAKGVQQLEDHANDPKNATKNSQSAAKGESNTSPHKGNESSALDEEKGKFRTSLSDKLRQDNSLVGLAKRHRARLALASATFGVAGLMVGGFIAAPSFILSHISTLITDKTSELQVNSQAKYRRSKFASFTDRFTIDGRRSGALIAEMKKFGYKIDVKNGTFQAPGGSSKPLAEAGEEFSEFMDQRYKIFGVPTRSQTWKTKRTDALFNRHNVVRSSSVTSKPGDLEDPEIQMNKTQNNSINEGSEIDTSIDESPAKRDTDSGNENIDSDNESYNQANDEAAEALVPEDNVFRQAADDLADGVSINELGGVGPIGDELDLGYGPNLVKAEVRRSLLSPGGAAAGAVTIAKSALLPADIADKACTANSRLDMAVKVARAATSVKMMRAALVFVSADDGQRRQEASFDLMMQIVKRVMLSDKAMGNFANSAGFQFASNGSFSRSALENQPSKFNTSGKLSAFWGAVRSATGKIPGCSVLGNTAFQIGLGIGAVALSIAVPGSGAAAGTGVKTALQTAVQGFFTKKALTGILAGLIIDYSFEEILNLTTLYVQKQLTMAITGQETGGMYSSLLFSGAGVLTKQRFLNAGQVPATATQYAQARDIFLAEKREESKNKSLAQRLFDFSDYDSLAYQTTATLALNSGTPSAAISNFGTSVASLPSLMTNTVTSLTTGRAYAQDSDEQLAFDTISINGTEYATDPSGNLLTIMRDDISSIDVDENLQELEDEGHISSEATGYEPKSSEFTTFMELCIDSVDQISAMEEGEDCAGTKTLTKKFYAHLAYLDSIDFIDSSLFSNEISSYGSGSSTQPTNAPNAYSVSAIEPAEGLIQGTSIEAQDTSNMECPISDTVQDLGIETEAYVKGVRYSVRLCAVHGIRINVLIAKQLDDMLNEMADEGYTVRGSGGFRDHASQVAGYAGGAGAGTFAKPGYSNHQFGLAIDFSCQGQGQSYTAGTGRYRDSFLQNLSQYPCLEWLSRNSPRYGLLNSCVAQGSQGEIRATSGGCEWWHFSPDGK